MSVSNDGYFSSVTTGTLNAQTAKITNLTVTSIETTGTIYDGVPAHPFTPVVGKGQVWVKNTNPTKIFFTNDVGTDLELSNIGFEQNVPNAVVRYNQTLTGINTQTFVVPGPSSESTSVPPASTTRCIIDVVKGTLMVGSASGTQFDGPFRGVNSFSSGADNTVSSNFSCCGGGQLHTLTGNNSGTLGGQGFTNAGPNCAIAGGLNNIATAALAVRSFIGGGSGNNVQNRDAVILGGVSMTSVLDNTVHLQALAVKNTASAASRTGKAVLIAGTVTVATQNLDLLDIITVGSSIVAGVPGSIFISARVAGTPGSFTITSSSGADTSTVGYLIYRIF